MFRKNGKIFGFPQSEKLLLVHGHQEEFSHKSLDNINVKAAHADSTILSRIYCQTRALSKNQNCWCLMQTLAWRRLHCEDVNDTCGVFICAFFS